MHALTGTWLANLEQSRRDPNDQFHRATMRFDVDGDRVSLVYGGVNASGRQEQGGQTWHAATVFGTDGSGKVFEQVIVFDRDALPG